MGNNLPDIPPPKPHDVVLNGQVMPTPEKSWIMQLRRPKQTADVHWVSWILQTPRLAPVALGTGSLVGHWRTMGMIADVVRVFGQHLASLVRTLIGLALL